MRMPAMDKTKEAEAKAEAARLEDLVNRVVADNPKLTRAKALEMLKASGA
jgi:hypothetical protein